MSDTNWPKLLDKLLKGIDLTSQESENLMHAWLQDKLEPVQTGAFLAALRSKSISGNELLAMSRILIDNCSLPSSISPSSF